MPQHVNARHTITIDAPIERCFMFFTPAGEELWVDGWQPHYLWPSDGHTEAAIVNADGDALDSEPETKLLRAEGPQRIALQRFLHDGRADALQVLCVVAGDAVDASAARSNGRLPT